MVLGYFSDTEAIRVRISASLPSIDFCDSSKEEYQAVNLEMTVQNCSATPSDINQERKMYFMHRLAGRLAYKT